VLNAVTTPFQIVIVLCVSALMVTQRITLEYVCMQQMILTARQDSLRKTTNARIVTKTVELVMDPAQINV
jgi:hypothetical protein